MFISKGAFFLKGLARLRMEKKLTQARLGEVVDTDGNTISRYERGAIKPSIEMLQRLADYFNVSVDELLNGPAVNEIQVRILVKESLDEMEEIDLSKEAPYLETVTLTPHKSAITVVFDSDKTVEDAIEAIRRETEKIESARRALYA